MLVKRVVQGVSVVVWQPCGHSVSFSGGAPGAVSTIPSVDLSAPVPLACSRVDVSLATASRRTLPGGRNRNFHTHMFGSKLPSTTRSGSSSSVALDLPESVERRFACRRRRIVRARCASGLSMYERHFGMTDLPFKLSPDPFFYFGSKQHQAALEGLRQAFARKLPFIVMSGEVGAGKTTILRAWLPEMEAAGVAVGRIANTQLDADDLMFAIAAAFGIEMAFGANCSCDEVLREYLRTLDGRHALVVIDEAQNLNHVALQRLAVLAGMASEEGASLRICLAGQPELRANIADPTLHDFQSKVQQSTHLGALDAAQTRHYIEHRLRKVGWSGAPSFESNAFESIHQLTGGIPRRINVLCNRLLLMQFLGDCRSIDVQSVSAAANALHAEIGDKAFADDRLRFESGARRLPLIDSGAILVVVGGHRDQIRAIPLLHALGRRRDLPPSVLLVVSDDCTWRLNRDLRAFASISQQTLALAQDVQPQTSVITLRFKQLVQSCLPCAVVVIDGGELSLCCATVAHEACIPLVHIGSKSCAVAAADGDSSYRVAIDRLADLRFGDPSEGRLRGDACTSPIIDAGNLLIDSVHFAVRLAARRARLDAYSVVKQYVDKLRGYGVVALEHRPQALNELCHVATVQVIRGTSRELPLIWPLPRETILSLHQTGIAQALAGERIVCIEDLGYTAYVGLLRGATCVLTDTLDVMVEAAALGVACLWIGADGEEDAGCRRRIPCFAVGGSVTRATRAVWDILFGMRQPAPVSGSGWDGHAAIRMSAYLARWLIEPNWSERARALDTDHRLGAGCEAVGRSVD